MIARRAHFGSFGEASLLPGSVASMSCDQLKAQASLAKNQGLSPLAKAYEAAMVLRQCGSGGGGGALPAPRTASASGGGGGSGGAPAGPTVLPTVEAQDPAIVPPPAPSAASSKTPYIVGGLVVAAALAYFFTR